MQSPPCLLLNKDGSDPFPCIQYLNVFFMGKGIRTVFFSIGSSSSCLSELEIAEIIGCPINIIYTNESQVKQWEEVKACLKTHKPPNDPISTFSEKSQEKWVLPKNVRILSEWKSGNVLSIVQDACKSMSISEGDARIDILKIDLNGGAECRTLYEVLDAGFRPALIIIRWTQEPDSHPGVRLAAGNLQNCGYALLKKEGDKYLYYYVDNDMYSTCSWQIEGSINPMVDAIIQQGLCEVNRRASKMDIKDSHGNPIDIDVLERAEQDLAREYIKEDDVVFELGARYGSVSCVINSKLNCKTNQVVVEPDERVWEALERNKDVNNCEFHIVKGFVSSKKLGLTAIDSYNEYGTTSIEDESSTIPSYTLEEIKGKYNLKFNVLVADCEGFLETFFDENPTFYDGLRLIIFEEDYPEKCNYGKIQNTLFEKGFTKVIENTTGWSQSVWIKSVSKTDKNTAVFTNDNHVEISLLDHPFSQGLKRRDNHEVLFRRINTFLIENKVIKNSIIDLGAWIGDNTIPWAKNIDGTVFAIDPSPNNCEFIYKTCQLNNITNVKILQSAISNKKELLTTNDNIDHCSFVYGNPALNGTTRVNAVSLDYLFEVNAIDNIGYIHLDVEGMEYKILEGSSTLIDACRPLISFEQHLEIDDYAVILSYLQNKQYVIFLVDEVLPGCREDCRNSFAFPAEIYNETLIENINKYIGKNILVNMCTTSSSNIGNLIKNILLKKGVEKVVDINTVINTDAC